MNIDNVRQLLQTQGQLGVLEFWDRLEEDQCHALLADIAAVDWPLMEKLVATGPQADEALPAARIKPPEAVTQQALAERPQLRANALNTGIELIRGGQVAALTVAGGQGTRLGFKGPKGLFPITPVKEKSLFQYFAESISATELRYRSRVPWYIMTSPDNAQETATFFDQHAFFGLKPEHVHFFQQGVMPAVSTAGKVLLAQTHRLALSPDGHGGTLRPLYQSGALSELMKQGIQYLSYFQVDNPLIPPVDPLFIGLVTLQGSEFGSKVVRKAYAEEKVGVFVSVDDVLRVIEYIDFPSELSTMCNDDGTRTFDFANIACHVLSTALIQRLTGDDHSTALPYHRALKKVTHVDSEHGGVVEPAEPNAIKFEQFIFDAIPLATKPLLLEVARADEFSPVKIRRESTARVPHVNTSPLEPGRWLEDCGVACGAQAGSEQAIEISPRFALDVEMLREKIGPTKLNTTVPAIYLGEEE